jgi:hypothetical protein
MCTGDYCATHYERECDCDVIARHQQQIKIPEIPMPRHITAHKLNGLNDAIQITALDVPGPGGANHKYEIDIVGGAPTSGGMTTVINFQNGPIGESGFNGISNEALVAIVIDRMRGFQHQRFGELVPPSVGQPGDFDFNSRGKYACRDNACALTHLEEALFWLQNRTRQRLARGVEGTHTV